MFSFISIEMVWFSLKFAYFWVKFVSFYVNGQLIDYLVECDHKYIGFDQKYVEYINFQLNQLIFDLWWSFLCIFNINDIIWAKSDSFYLFCWDDTDSDDKIGSDIWLKVDNFY